MTCLRGDIPLKTSADKCATGAGQMFEQLDDPKLAGRKSRKERLSEGAVILVVVAVVIGVLVYALISK
jgi:hypothetical protein